MKGRDAPRFVYTGIIILACVALYLGWKSFWFLTDDAHIAFRYVSNSLLGHGYTWNPPPFRPVEGYTSFLWVALLDVVWRVTGAEPPRAANVLSLIFSYLTLFAVVAFLLRMRLSEQLRGWRPVLVFLLLLGVLSNRTFLAWTSSGLETALFQFFFLLWVFCGIALRAGTRGWWLALSTIAAMVYLSRPDGLLVALATVAAMAAVYVSRVRGRGKLLGRPSGMPSGRLSGDVLGALPLAIVVIHLVWRRATYGAWLPNTYYAKLVGPWPESGIRYLASFVLEYGLWVWILAALVALVRSARSDDGDVALRMRRWIGSLRDPSVACRRIVVATVILHAAYYTVIVGGDHFEYRVYAHLIPLLFISFLWIVDRLRVRAACAAGLLLLFVLASWPIPWTHRFITRDIHGRKATFNMQVPVTDHFPPWARFYTHPFDRLQSWLMDHGVCNRHQEHKEFYLYQTRIYPSRREGEAIRPGADYPVHDTGTVGVAAWAMPHAAIIDLGGLNDYVIARTKPMVERASRIMAHDRSPPDGYVAAFRPNVMLRRGRAGVVPRDRPLTEDEIVAIESEWWQRADEGVLRGRRRHE